MINRKPHTFDPSRGKNGQWVEDTTPLSGQPNGGEPPLTTASALLSKVNERSDLVTKHTTSDNGRVATEISQGTNISGLTGHITSADPVECKLQLNFLKAQLEAEIERL